MKYNDEIFDISAQLYSYIQDDEINSTDEKMQNDLLKILLKKFSSELKENKTNNGIVKTKFKCGFYQDSEEGYNLIKKLVGLKKFDSFASQYCFYLGDIEYRCDESYDSYYEIIWDYKTYFESFSMGQIDVEDKLTSAFAQALSDFKKLPLEYQTTLIKYFLNKVDECKKNVKKEEDKKRCQIEGHQFSKWKKETYKKHIGSIIDHMRVHDYEVSIQMWCKTCTRCGFKETCQEEPQEAIDERLEKQKQAKIKRLEQQLKKLKEEN